MVSSLEYCICRSISRTLRTTASYSLTNAQSFRALSKYHAITGQSIRKLTIVYSCLAGAPSPSENEGCVANTQPGPYSYHYINVTVVCSVDGTEVVTSVCCYLMPTIMLSIKKKFLEPEMCRIDCASNSLSS